MHSAGFIAGTVAGIRIKTENLPIILTGDFNLERTERAYKALATGELIDSKPENDQTGTFCGFEVGGLECRAIDFIFYSKEWVLRHYEVLRNNDGKHYPSDHLPVLTVFQLSKGN